MSSGKHTPAHGAGVVLELHFNECRVDPRYLACALARASPQAGNAPRQPSEQTKAGKTERNGHIEPTAYPQHTCKPQRAQTAAGFEDCSRRMRIDLGERIERPQ